MRRDDPRPIGLSSILRGAVAQQQVRTGVALKIALDEQINDLASLDYDGNGRKVITVNSAGDGFQLVDSVDVTSGATATRVAGEALGGNRAVRIAADNKVYYANPDETSRFTIGLTTGSATLGATVDFQTEGEMEEPSWSWSATEIVWLAANGTLTQTVPTSGHLFQVGIPMGPTRLRIEPQLIAKIS